MNSLKLALALLILIWPASLRADPATPPRAEALLHELLETGPRSEMFTSAFLDAIPLTQIQDISREMRAEIGPLTHVHVDGDRFEIETASHIVTGLIGLDGMGRIEGLRILGSMPRVATLEEALEGFDNLGSDVAWLVLKNGEVLADHRADQPLAVGSAFKIAVLKILSEDIAQGVLRWDDIVHLDNALKSLPSGMLQDFPDAAPITVQTLASLMISISDNTATDHLLHLVGRPRVAAALGMGFVPSTREFFALKFDNDARQTYLDQPSNRAEIAARAAQTLEKSASLPAYQPGLEWYVGLDRLCALLIETAELPPYRINSGPASAKDWHQIAYKGGSETGVLNMTTVVQDAHGQKICAAVTVNNDVALNEKAAFSAYRAFLNLLRREL
ncbi:serine hydrolase [uncultured Pelagimonas sp.]|uniref:serine hydrolase n=1 Tax=uncultured Pelagimonas sp. TaxID=1618102 RepID=UPI002607E844|nr:serine hydrolase [uncultured Pelagimonas sp.]